MEILGESSAESRGQELELRKPERSEDSKRRRKKKGQIARGVQLWPFLCCTCRARMPIANVSLVAAMAISIKIATVAQTIAVKTV